MMNQFKMILRRYKMEFTKEELHEIEKGFDILAGLHSNRMAEIIFKLQPLTNKKAKKYTDRLFDCAVEAHDIYRTISAKAKRMHNKK